MNNFNNDLKLGNLGEKIIATYLKKYYNFEILNYNNDYKYDLHTLYKGMDIKFEIKTDRYEYKNNKVTNNMFIELSCNNKLSGINKTEADIFIYYYPDYEKAYIIKVDKLKEFIRNPENMDKMIYRTQNGDGGRVRGVTINRLENENMFKVLNIKKLPIWN